MDRQEVADLGLEAWGYTSSQDLEGLGDRPPEGVIQRLNLLVGEGRALAKRQEPGSMEDLIAVGVADAGDERLVAQQVLELARMPSDAVAPDRDGQRRIVRVGSDLIDRQPRHDPLDIGRQQVHLAHLRRIAVADLGRGFRRRQPRSAPGPGGLPRTGAFAGRPEAEHEGGLRRPFEPWLGGELEPAREHGIDDHAVTVQADLEEFAALAHSGDGLADEGVELGWCPAHGKGSGGFGERDRTATERGIERFGDDGQVGEFRHGARL